MTDEQNDSEFVIIDAPDLHAGDVVTDENVEVDSVEIVDEEDVIVAFPPRTFVEAIHDAINALHWQLKQGVDVELIPPLVLPTDAKRGDVITVDRWRGKTVTAKWSGKEWGLSVTDD